MKFHPIDALKIITNVKVRDRPALSGILLFAFSGLAFVWANSPWEHNYWSMWETPINLRIGAFSLEKNLHHFINDGLMAIFFFVVGLELKKALISGPLNNAQKAFLPFVAAAGGMLFPALIYLLFNPSGPASNGWGIPMATDIAFALGILALAAPKAPLEYRLFLIAIAIADDLGAVLVIAFFYTSEVQLDSLIFGFVALAFMFAANRAGVQSPWPYAIMGIGGVWLAFLLSGIHPTIAGVLAAFMIPAKAKWNNKQFLDKSYILFSRFTRKSTHHNRWSDQKNNKVLRDFQQLSKSSVPPLQRLEHSFQPFVQLGILPLFAFANAGVTIPKASWDFLGNPILIGVFFGLVLGKPLGIGCMAWLFSKWTGQPLPVHPRSKAWWALAMLGGVGFTMSLFIAVLAFEDPDHVALAKVGVLAGSFLAAIISFLLLYRSKVNHPEL